MDMPKVKRDELQHIRGKETDYEQELRANKERGGLLRIKVAERSCLRGGGRRVGEVHRLAWHDACLRLIERRDDCD